MRDGDRIRYYILKERVSSKRNSLNPDQLLRLLDQEYGRNDLQDGSKSGTRAPPDVWKNRME